MYRLNNTKTHTYYYFNGWHVIRVTRTVYPVAVPSVFSSSDKFLWASVVTCTCMNIIIASFTHGWWTIITMTFGYPDYSLFQTAQEQRVQIMEVLLFTKHSKHIPYDNIVANCSFHENSTFKLISDNKTLQDY